MAVASAMPNWLVSPKYEAQRMDTTATGNREVSERSRSNFLGYEKMKNFWVIRFTLSACQKLTGSTLDRLATSGITRYSDRPNKPSNMTRVRKRGLKKLNPRSQIRAVMNTGRNPTRAQLSVISA